MANFNAAWLSSTPNANTVADPRVLINLGVNDTYNGGSPALPNEAQWKADYAALIDAVLVKMPHAKIYLAKPWCRGRDAIQATMATWIDAIVATASGAGKKVYVGPDENVWLKGADNGATYTVDGVHYSTAGYDANAAQWAAILWP